MRGETLNEVYKDHLLQGRSDPERECHITPDWLLIYVFEGDLSPAYLGFGLDSVILFSIWWHQVPGV
ncbi:MAG: type II toxin-antitoxin system YafQ family toxin [Chloroflexi bacterium]|nr:type II toxin-antitoxin system YafQ family toxin [Chloroflexota bacterium]